MEADERIIASLMKLGLTRYEALAYLALVKLGSGTVSDIHRISGVPTTKLYEVLNRLEARGWVDILRERPLKFKARPPREVLDTAVQDILRDVEDTKNILDQIYEKRLEVERSDVWMVRGFNNVESKMISMIRNARERVLLALSRLAVNFLNKARKALLDAYWRGVDVKVLMGRIDKVPDLGGIEIVTMGPVPVGPEISVVHSMIVVDAAELLLVLPIGMSQGRLSDVVGVWVRDKSLAQLAQEYVLYMIKVAREVSGLTA